MPSTRYEINCIISLTAITERMEMKIVLAFLSILMFPVLIILLSGDIFWIAGWIFSI